MIFSFLLASLPTAPLTAPETIVISHEFPSGTIPHQILKKADWLKVDNSVKENSRIDYYVGLSSRSDNIVSLYVLKRYLSRNTYIPSHFISMNSYDCANYRYLYNNALVKLTDRLLYESKLYDEDESILRVSPGQVSVTIEGYPYWAKKINYIKHLKWEQIKPGSNGAFQLYYACKNY